MLPGFRPFRPPVTKPKQPAASVLVLADEEFEVVEPISRVGHDPISGEPVEELTDAHAPAPVETKPTSPAMAAIPNGRSDFFRDRPQRPAAKGAPHVEPVPYGYRVVPIGHPDCPPEPAGIWLHSVRRADGSFAMMQENEMGPGDVIEPRPMTPIEPKKTKKPAGWEPRPRLPPIDPALMMEALPDRRIGRRR